MSQQLTLSEWLQLLEKRHPTEIELGLARIARVADRLQAGSVAPTVISVAGTNGKGSCIAILQNLLLSLGKRVGSYTSPHLIRYNERICINGVPVADESIIRAFEDIEAARGDISLTYFEFGTLAALLILKQEKVDVALLEVGLGGRLDAVNLVDADFAVVTSIALDHQQWLGSNLADIAYEKACIARAGKPLIYGDRQPYGTVEQLCDELPAPLFCNGKQFKGNIDGGKLSVTCQKADGTEISYRNLPVTSLPDESLLCALQVISLMDLTAIADSDLIARSLNTTRIPGRLQQFDLQGVGMILDVAHNPAACRRLAHQLQSHAEESHDQRRVKAVIAAMSDKDIEGMLSPLKPLVDDWYAAEIPLLARAISAQTWRQILYNVAVFSSVEQALEAALDSAKSGDVIVVFGSFYAVGPVLAWLQARGKSL